jgi:Ras-related protein Rab-1A
MMCEYDHLFKVIIIGDSGVGKSCLLSKFTDDTFNPQFITTIGIDFKIKTVELDDKLIKLHIWDTAGQERFRTITTSYYRGANAIIMAFDMTNLDSFNNMERWIGEINKYASPNIYKILIGTKCDETRKIIVDDNIVYELTEKHKVDYIKTSAKTGLGVNEVFINICSNVLHRKIDPTIKVKQTTQVKTKCCV